jgi:hypothetical protein
MKSPQVTPPLGLHIINLGYPEIQIQVFAKIVTTTKTKDPDSEEMTMMTLRNRGGGGFNWLCYRLISYPNMVTERMGTSI